MVPYVCMVSMVSIPSGFWSYGHMAYGIWSYGHMGIWDMVIWSYEQTKGYSNTPIRRGRRILRLPIIPIIRLPIIPIRLLIITYIRLPIIPITYNTYKITYNNDHQLFKTPDPKLNVVGIVGQNQHSVVNSHYLRVDSAFLRTTDDLSTVTMTSWNGSQSILISY